jgi:hypothetical protein
MKSVELGFFTANFGIWGAETSAFCNHAAQTAQTAQVAVKGIFRFSKGRAGPAPKMTDHAGLRVDFRRFRIRRSPVQIAECVIRRVGGSAVECEIIADQCRHPASKELNGQEEL